MTDDPCDACGEPVADALARTVRLTVDRSQIDAQRLCPECFADWIHRYKTEMEPDTETQQFVEEDGDADDIIID
ncbi:DUF7569 family protein [Halanaeroarchaeum sulfurireducens]|uniref:Small CPxCG-related zinc finger protein n=1 Tax=Halanaeroarchaeum sulfurireducens TaxID=1604004 RepID=A0A0F7PBC1_9EURY|nr:hypothetical protein [Halanaeroarchaeum sulfurireducens]AKH96633.1 hypothetical protein HLASF_0119 [Halanaeroarchaeum sulfurireducens]ALG81035.1 hypothetical protein HLASA_0119 [Halanaeroarchaeum sulfurireducens]